MKYGNELSGCKFIIADDVPVNLDMLEKLISSHGGSADRAANGKQALDLFAASEEGEYSAILLDIKMPEMDGHEAAATIRSSAHPDAETIPIIALTSENEEKDFCKSRNCGINIHLLKPYNHNEIISALENAIIEGKIS